VQVSRGETNAVLWQQIGRGLSYVLIWSPVTAFVALNFTGSTTFTSKTGVRREMYRYLRLMAGILIAGVILSIALNLL
ncbi:MAG: hypothetical protein U1B77_00475, partial [Dehalococcoidales bacterium]|nr:hypothetical protein [Dehalococcoidales bacterium]